MKRRLFVTAILVLPALYGQGATDRLVIAPSGSSATIKLLKMDVFHGRLTVQAHSGRDVIITGPELESTRPDASGMRRIPSRGGLDVEEENNVVTIRVGPTSRSGDWVVSVPKTTPLQLRSTNAGLLAVDGVDSDMEINTTNGRVELRNVSGAVVAHSVNGSLKASLATVRSDKPASFSTVNGSVDITLPAATKARLKLRAENGAIYTDFDVMLQPGNASQAVEAGGQEGRFRIKHDRTIYATINGGGAELSIASLNGRITVRKQN